MNGHLVSNTGPIIALALVDRLDILSVLFEQVSIPERVHQEVIHGGSAKVGIEAYTRATWIELRRLKSPLDSLLLSVLDDGEAAVIQLAREQNADFVLIDEKKARKVARNVYGLNVVGVARVLVEARKRNLIDSVGRLLAKMREGGYWIHDDIVHRSLKEAGEATWEIEQD